ncbi:MAG: hypothetical protein ABSG25_01615 [Bryobacteraceae bacterium]
MTIIDDNGKKFKFESINSIKLNKNEFIIIKVKNTSEGVYKELAEFFNGAFTPVKVILLTDDMEILNIEQFRECVRVLKLKDIK